MKNTIDLPLSSFYSVKMSLSELKRRNLIVKVCLENPNKSQTVEHFKLLGFKILTIYLTIRGFEEQKKVERISS
jgi:hypothetical protein